MSDDLVKRLREPFMHVKHGQDLLEAWRLERAEAADRIEELEANINIKADFIDATINQLAAPDQRIEELEAKLGKYNLLWQAYDGETFQMYVDANEARIDAESKLAECEARLEKVVGALEDMCVEFRGYDLPYGSKAYTKATATLSELNSQMKGHTDE